MSLQNLITAIKHLPGKHPQKRHTPKSGKTAPKGRSGSKKVTIPAAALHDTPKVASGAMKKKLGRDWTREIYDRGDMMDGVSRSDDFNRDAGTKYAAQARDALKKMGYEFQPDKGGMNVVRGQTVAWEFKSPHNQLRATVEYNPFSGAPYEPNYVNVSFEG